MNALFLALTLLSTPASAGTDVGGYFRIAARPDFQGGNGALGHWNLYGRLLNERSYALLNLRQDLLAPEPGSQEIWASVHARIEGGSIGSADSGNGALGNLRLSQVYVKAGNVLIPGVTWQLGTLDWYMGDLGLYDFRPANIFAESVGLSGRIDTERVELVLGIGDAGFFMRPDEYNTILTPGGTLRLRFGAFEIGGGGQLYIEPMVEGKRSAPHTTPDLGYEEYVRGEVVQNFLASNPGQEDLFPNPIPTSAMSYKIIGYVGFGGFGPLIWNNTFLNIVRLHPETKVSETYDGRVYDLYVGDLTDERTQFNLGNEMQLRIVPERYDVTWAFYYGNYTDADNDILPTDDDRVFYSTVLRNQFYLTPAVHILLEGSYANERSRNGNAYRNSANSIFQNSGGVVDSDGLEYGDDDTRITVQGKGGLVLNPMGTGIFSRPSLRVLYGIQYSTQNNAFGNDFVESLDQFNDFGNVERHIHHIMSLETEVWF